jgi:phosphoribosylformylglycinamidine cyclo-ligase
MSQYSNAGVDVTAGYEAVKRIKHLAESTYTNGVIGTLGGFGGLFAPDFSSMEEPVLISGTDGVGTKLKLAFASGIHTSVGIDCVAMCVNDILCAGAKPLFFLDYIACGKNIPERIEQIAIGIADGCRQSNMALIGGETAEMPGFYPEDEYDLAGFCVGMVDRKKIIDGSTILPGDVLLGVPSSGFHSNGFSLLRSLFPNPDPQWLETMLTPTRIYKKDLDALHSQVTIKGLSHITGGGFIENIPRMLPHSLVAVMHKPNSEPEIFQKVRSISHMDDSELYNTFNMGVGMVVCVAPEEAEKVQLPVIGHIEEGTGGIRLW